MELGIELTIIDPCLDADLVAKYSDREDVHFHQGASLDVLPGLSGELDCILIDGDHNWYTVYSELCEIERHDALKPGGTIFLHDVMPPFDRRDMYYRPELIPAEHRKPYGRRDPSSWRWLADGEEGGLCTAFEEGGPRNGVLTAVEDFMGENPDQYAFFIVPAQNGLGVMLRSGGGSASVFKRFERTARRVRIENEARRIAAGVARRLKSLVPGLR